MDLGKRFFTLKYIVLRTFKGTSTPPDVHFTLDKRTLIALVDGTLSPMTAYLDGLVQIQGSIQDAISLRHLAECAAEIPTTKKIN